MRFLPGSALFFLCLAAACSSGDRRNIRDYYFPVADLRSGKVYEYDLAQGDSSAPEFWHFRSFPRDSGLFLAGTCYDHRFQIGQIVREKVTDEGSTVREYFLYEPDAETGKQIQTTAIVESGRVFPFAVSDSGGIFLFRLRYHPAADPGMAITISRKRVFLGSASDFEFQDAVYPCIRFGLIESAGTPGDSTALWQARGEEWYAKGLGLVYYRKIIGEKPSVRFEYRLKDIFPMSELEKRAEAYFGE